MKKTLLAAFVSICAFTAGQLMAGPPTTCHVCQWACNNDTCALMGCIDVACKP